MTQEEWLASDDPHGMLAYLRGDRGRGCRAQDCYTHRKQRLFACACCRQIWGELTDKRSRQAVEVAEHYADGLAKKNELNDANEKAFAAWWPADSPSATAYYACAKDISSGVMLIAQNPFTNTTQTPLQAALLRDIFGNPFRQHPIQLYPAFENGWLSKPKEIAQAAYDERAFDRMPVLGDALEDAGCTDADILKHCREPGEHFRGCWVVDLLLDKN